jgi:hypothetical protein
MVSGALNILTIRDERLSSVGHQTSKNPRFGTAVHAGRPCPTCTGNAGFSRITDEEMKVIMKNAVDRLYALLVLKLEQPSEYERKIQFGERYTTKWDDPT